MKILKPQDAEELERRVLERLEAKASPDSVNFEIQKRTVRTVVLTLQEYTRMNCSGSDQQS